MQTDYSSIDHKAHSKERKKNIEENRERVYKRVNSIAEKKKEEEQTNKEEQTQKEEQETKTHNSSNKSADIYLSDRKQRK